MSIFDKIFYLLLVSLNILVAIAMFYVAGLVLTLGWNTAGMPELEVWQGVCLVVLMTFLALPMFHAKES